MTDRATAGKPVAALRLPREQQRGELQVKVAELERAFAAARRNCVTEENSALWAMVGEEVANLRNELGAARKELAAVPDVKTSTEQSPEEEVDRALALLEDIRRIAAIRVRDRQFSCYCNHTA